MKISVSQFLVWIIIFIFGVNFLNQITGIQINEFFYFILVFGYMFYINKKTDKDFLINLIFIVTYIVYGVLLLTFNNSGIGSIYTVLTGIVVTFAFQNIVFTKMQEFVLMIILLTGNIYWTYMSDGWYEKYLNVLKTDQGIVNPNGVGYFICFSYIYIYLFYCGTKEELCLIFLSCLHLFGV